ncbi:M28 family peptidase [Terriglobus roseus]|uniref:Zn-dependent amino-or carboxypeptidase, M28 family n=1 Tax=Terriglobus roseus TaxID=392734 RepID=A0A1H4SZP9_9BACT|nr:M28 family peptidase [Terriglobus roseus]SEC49520.1 Zn-dependent amino-or carboxypeptidase, M28 family [Terriglobus roseus]
MRRTAAALLVSFSLTLAAHAQIPLLSERTDWSEPAAAWWSHVQYLADDKLQGRRTGTPGYDAAVAYVESQFKAIGLKPAGTDGYKQQIDFQPMTLDLEKSSAVLKHQGASTPLTLGTDVYLTPLLKNSAVEAPLAFIGYGLRIPAKHINNYTDADVKGRIVVFYNYPPEHLLGPQRAYGRSNDQRWKALKAAGAVGMIQIAMPRPAAADAPPAKGPAPAPSALYFSDPSLESLPGIKVVGTLTDAGAAKLFAGTGHTPAELTALAKAGMPIPSFKLSGTLSTVTTSVAGTPFRAPNVIGMVEGSDSKLKKEYVVVSAHLDHLGVRGEGAGDHLYNGAMDNASGSASVIECAKILMAQKTKPKRSILFITLAGEELGELGSSYFARKPTVPKQDIVADLNMDMYLPLFPLRYIEVQGMAESTLGNDARAAFQSNDVEVQFDKQPDENRFVRSDQVNFVKQGIPALAFKFGWTPDSPEMKTFNEWVKTRYHKPSDDLNQPVDKVAAAQFTVVLAQLTTRVANGPRPEWYPESSFALTATK